MAKQPKAKQTAGTRNSDRPSGKASKQNPGKRRKATGFSEQTKILMGQGSYPGVAKRWNGKHKTAV